MKRFRFRLQQVLRVRTLQEDQARAALLTANRAAHDTATDVEARLVEYSTRSMPLGAQSTAAFERSLFLLDTAAGKVDVARADREALAVVDLRRADWVAARRRVAALERLEERRRDEHELENRRAEDRLVDDMVVARFGGIR